MTAWKLVRRCEHRASLRESNAALLLLKSWGNEMTLTVLSGYLQSGLMWDYL